MGFSFFPQLFEERPLFSACFWGLGWTIWSQHSSPFPPWQLKDQFRNLRFVLVGTRSLSWGSRFLRPSQECAERQSWKSSSETLKKEEAKGTKGSSQQRNVYNIKLEHFLPKNVPIDPLSRYSSTGLRPRQECLEAAAEVNFCPGLNILHYWSFEHQCLHCIKVKTMKLAC